jgi:hypothetical protein
MFLNQGTSQPQASQEEKKVNGDMASSWEELVELDDVQLWEELVELDDVQLATVVGGFEKKKDTWVPYLANNGEEEMIDRD